ncbi:hypothetical protein MY10362_000517 [Beauveria mimosiformis]
MGQQADPVAQALLQDDNYKTQSEAGIFDGLMTMQPGVPRDEWARHLFHSAYEAEGVMASQRPKYGALGLVRNANGPAPRFGSCFFHSQVPRGGAVYIYVWRIRRAVLVQKAADEMDAILAALMEESFTRDSALGHNLDHIIDAQIHGEVLLGHDVEALVVDPAFRDKSVGQHLCGVASAYEFTFRYLGRYSLHADAVSPDFADRQCHL